MATAVGNWNTSKVTSESAPCQYEDQDECMEECQEELEEEQEEEEDDVSTLDPDDLDEIESTCEITCQSCTGYDQDKEEEQEEENETENQMSSQGDTASSSPPLYHFDGTRNRKERKHHYTFDVDHKGLDINGFILHTNKHKGKRHKFRVYLDSNENGRFDKKDQLIGRTGLKHKHAAKGVGNLLDEDEIGQVEVKFKRSPLMQSDESYGDSIDTHLAGLSSNLSASSGYQIVGQTDPNKLESSNSDAGNEPTYSVNSMSFSDSSGAEVSSIVVDCGCVY
tara:strand:+ start:82 stop:921 length:840 start_codon:yes stop_codon:yes gene_type:complete